MKTPRDILFARHQAAAPKLDAIRRSVLDGLHNERTKKQSFLATLVSSLFGCSDKLWQELVWPSRRIWSGLATVWVLIFIVNFSQSDNVSSVTGKPVRAGEITMSLQAQQHWINELLADRSSPPDADRSRHFTPRPRTEAPEIAAV